MTKKGKIIFIALSFISLFLSAIVWFIVSDLVAEDLGAKIGTLTTYEREYHSNQLWWIFLTFIPLPLFTLVFGILFKERDVIIVSVVITHVIILCGCVFAIRQLEYSTSINELVKIEEKIDYIFPDDTTIVIHYNVKSSSKNDKDIKIISEGVIRIPGDEEFKNVENNLNWSNKIDESIEQYLPEMFYFRFNSLDKFLHHINDDNILTFLVYDLANNLIYFTTVEIIE